MPTRGFTAPRGRCRGIESGEIVSTLLEQELRRFPETISCKLKENGDGKTRIYVLLRSGSSIEAFLEHALSVAKRRFGLELTREDFVLSSPASQAAVASHPSNGVTRPKIESFGLKGLTDGVEVEVELSWDGASGKGTASERRSGNRPLRAVVDSALVAVAELIGHKDKLFYSDIVVLDLNEAGAVMVLVDAVTPWGELALTGSALSRKPFVSLEEATLRATLDAVNRVLPRLRNGDGA